MTNNKTVWENDNGWLKTPSGTKIGRVTNNTIELYDKRTKVGIPMTLDDFTQIIGEKTETEITQRET